MKVFLFTTDEPAYGLSSMAVVQAETEKEARSIVSESECFHELSPLVVRELPDPEIVIMSDVYG
jgi:hypothetical protein